ncbi:DNA helicase protein [Dioscorea alata]|uniref:DNA helicase protein n=1 Tax=Dioscorea alata TaxID=55571 RepID=A0ACB7ULP0_DIOAL|nr:DNA helicase protein [Dioscorea alata]
MNLDPQGLFRDHSDSDDEFELEKEKDPSKEMVVYLIDASPKMFDLVGNDKEKKNLQDLNGVFVFNVNDREFLDQPTAKLIKEFSCIEALRNLAGTFMSNIGSQYGIIPGSRENSLYSALWVAQALLRKGSPKYVSKRILVFTNEDNPFGNITGAAKTDMIRTTVQRAYDAQEMGISIEILPLSIPNEPFNVSHFYADLIGLEGDEVAQFLPSAVERLEDMTDQLTKRIFKKRIVRTISFSIAEGINIEVNTYALIRPALPGSVTWLDSVTNLSLKAERSFICADTGALVHEPPKRFHPYKNENVKFSVDELSEIKRISNGHLCLLGFKPLDLLKDYHNLKPSTFIFPTDEAIIGSTKIFIALHRSMLQLKRFALAFYGGSANPRLVALVAQDGVTSSSGQVEPPGMHMIYLPFSDDIRHVEELQTTADAGVPHATDDQIKKASVLMKRMELKDFSVCQFANPALQRHYGILQALALGEDEMPDIKDETLPDEDGMARPTIVNALEDFKIAVYGENHDLEEVSSKKSSGTDASRKRKAMVEAAVESAANHDWADLADNGKLKDLTVPELKNYLTAHNIPVTGKKEALISRILTHLGR